MLFNCLFGSLPFIQRLDHALGAHVALLSSRGFHVGAFISGRGVSKPVHQSCGRPGALPVAASLTSLSSTHEAMFLALRRT